MASTKKHDKSAAKAEKKRSKAEAKRRKKGEPADGDGARPSLAVRYAETVRGILYVIMGLSLLVALLLGHRGAVISLDDLVDSLFVARTGKVLLVLVGAALLIYGMKHLRLLR